MAEELNISSNLSKEEKYIQLYPQVKNLVELEHNLIANMANMCAALKQVFDFFWVGFYIVDDNQLILGPFQGPIACTRINFGRGVCGTTWKSGKTLIVPDVDNFPGHIACSSLSKSEIVVPIYNENNIVAVLDVDSEELNSFDVTDQKYLEEIIALLKF